MMTFKILILSILFLVTNHLLGQSNSLKKKQVLKIFKASIRQDYRTKITTNSNPWTTCNDDSVYYKSDTIKLISYSNEYQKCNCFCYIDWTFYKKDAFILTVEYINEPRRISVPKAENWFDIKLSQTKQGLILETFNQNKLINQFKVVSAGTTLILKRL